MKSEVFKNYCNYCTVVNENPVTLNYFGKLVKHCFPSVEVRKFGGRSEPTWYYFGLVPKGADGHHHLSSHYPGDLRREASPLHTDHHEELPNSLVSPFDLQVPRGMVPTISPRHLSPAAHEDCLPGLPPHSTSPIPISLGPKGGGNAPSQHYNTPPNGSYGSPSILVQSMLQNQLGAYSQSPLLNRRSGSFSNTLSSHSPRDSLHHQSSAPHASPGVARPSPIDARSFHENLNSQSPAEGARMQELRRHLLARSPYEPADLPPDNLYSRSPGDTAAQYCRSPRDSALEHRIVSGQSPGAHYPGDTMATLMYTGHSPVHDAPSFRQRAYLSGGGTVGGSGTAGSGAHPGVGVPGLVLRQAVAAAAAGQHKRHKLHQQYHHRDEYEMVQDMAVE